MRKILFVCTFLCLSLYLYCVQLTVLDWNVENFFDTIDNPKKQDTVLTEEEYRRKFQLVASTIKTVNADIVCLCEIENIDILSELGLECGYEYPYLVEGNDDRGINVAIMSRYELTYKSNRNMKVPHPNNPNYKFSRDCPVASFNLDGKNIYILVNHLKSMLGGLEKTQAKRIAQVNGILDIISGIYEQDDSPNIIVTGDFNTHRFTEPLNILQKAGLTIVNYRYKESDTYTHRYNKEYRDLDYFMLNDTIISNAKSYNMKTLLHKRNYASDHYPILLTLTF